LGDGWIQADLHGFHNASHHFNIVLARSEDGYDDVEGEWSNIARVCGGKGLGAENCTSIRGRINKFFLVTFAK
jgi:hypothetical protein